jgi:hypothetical protein
VDPVFELFAAKQEPQIVVLFGENFNCRIFGDILDAHENESAKERLGHLYLQS